MIEPGSAESADRKQIIPLINEGWRHGSSRRGERGLTVLHIRSAARLIKESDRLPCLGGSGELLASDMRPVDVAAMLGARANECSTPSCGPGVVRRGTGELLSRTREPHSRGGRPFGRLLARPTDRALNRGDRRGAGSTRPCEPPSELTQAHLFTAPAARAPCPAPIPIAAGQLAELSEAIARDRLRATARRLSVDPSNLRRLLGQSETSQPGP